MFRHCRKRDFIDWQTYAPTIRLPSTKYVTGMVSTKCIYNSGESIFLIFTSYHPYIGYFLFVGNQLVELVCPCANTTISWGNTDLSNGHFTFLDFDRHQIYAMKGYPPRGKKPPLHIYQNFRNKKSCIETIQQASSKIHFM